MIHNQKESDIIKYKETLEKAACVYVENKGYTTDKNVYVDDLIEAGLISKNLINPVTKKSVLEDNNSIAVEFDSNTNEKIFTYVELIDK